MSEAPKASRWSTTPRLRTLEGGHRRASWLELFFDLVIVVAIAQLVHTLERHHDWTGFLSIAGLFSTVFLGWQGFSFYADRFDTDDILYRIATFAQMIALLLIAMQIDNVALGEHVGFALAFAVLRGILVLQYVNVYRNIEIARPLARRYGGAYAISVVIWIISAFVPSPWFIVMWVGAMLLDLSMPWVNLRYHRSIPTDQEHVPERFGLFTLIVLGELVVVVGLGIADMVWSSESALIAIGGVFIGFCLWWLYFDELNEEHPLSREPFSIVTFAYSHLPLLCALVFVAGGINLLIAHPEGETAQMGLWALGGGVIVFILALTLANAQLAHGLKQSMLIARGSAIVALVLVVLLQPSAIVAVSLAAVVIVVLAATETVISLKAG